MWEMCDEARRPAGQDPDVVGLGTFISYTGSAGVAIVGLVLQYLLFHGSRGEDQHRENPVDALLLGTLRGAARSLGIKLSWLNRPPQEGRWRSAFGRCILSLGDVQLAMGFAALAYAYVTSFTEAMSVYHWWVIVGLVWFSVATNLATSAYLRTYFAKNSGERGWRTLLLFLLIVALAVSMLPILRVREAFARDPDDVQKVLSTNVLCYFPDTDWRVGAQPKSAGVLFAIAFGILVVASAILKLYELPGSVIYKWRDHYRGEMQQSLFRNMITCVRCEQRYMLLVVRPVLALWLVLRIYAELLNSIITQIFCVTAMFAWVVVRFIDIRNLGTPEPIRWTFGQIVVLALFAAPFASLGPAFLKIRLRFPRFGLCRRLRGIKWPKLRFRKQKLEELPVEQSDQAGNHVPAAAETAEQGRNGPGNASREPLIERHYSGPDQHVWLNTYEAAISVFPSPWFAIALPLAAIPSLLHLTLLMVLPHVPGYITPTNLLWKTGFWFVVYQPLVLFLFLLAGMIVEERSRRRRRLRSVYATLAFVALALSTASIVDTLWGLSGIPMSYIGMGALGLGLLIYIFYGLIARPSPLAKGKGRRPLRDGDDVEENAPLLGPRRDSLVRIFPVRKAKRWHGPSRRPTQGSKRKGYGTIDDSSSATARP